MRSAPICTLLLSPEHQPLKLSNSELCHKALVSDRQQILPSYRCSEQMVLAVTLGGRNCRPLSNLGNVNLLLLPHHLEPREAKRARRRDKKGAERARERGKIYSCP